MSLADARAKPDPQDSALGVREPDAPEPGRVRDCSDRVAQMERDLAELRERLQRVQDRRGHTANRSG